MTKQEQNDNPEIVEQAKRLGIPYWHTKSLDRVKQEIMEKELKDDPLIVPVESESPAVKEEKVSKPRQRRVAPKMPLRGVGEDARASLIRRMDDEQGEGGTIKHLFQSAGMSDSDLAKKGFERTGVTLKNDIVVRTDAKRYYEIQKNDLAHQRKMMDSIDLQGESIASLTEQPKKGKT